jgi:folate-binding Fe-S cluster repair protein YgfZ
LTDNPFNQGKVLYDVFLYTKTDPVTGQRNYLLEYDSRPSEATPMLSLLKRYVLRSKVRIRDVSEEYDVWAAWGDSEPARWETPRRWNWAGSGAVEPKWDLTEWPWGTKDETILDKRAMGMGRRLLVRKGDRRKCYIFVILSADRQLCSLAAQEVSDHEVASPEAYTLHRILRGVPEGQTDMPAMLTFPMDANLDVMGGRN